MEPMVDQRLEDLKRRQQADPDNTQLQFELLNARARIEGSSVYLELLEDRLKWNACHESVQDMAISFVGKEKLGSSYKHVETKKYSCGGQSHRIATFKHTKTGILLNLIPGGTYIMGDDESDEKNECHRTYIMGDDESDEKNECPGHSVKIKPLLVGFFPVRQSCWDKVGGPAKPTIKGADLPMETVSWDDCQAWLKKAGGGLRLPSESEWEYACRAGSTTQHFWGNDFDESYCWYGGNSNNKTHDVRAHDGKENAFGLVDMSGNVWEWCQDWYVGSYLRTPRDSQPFSEKGSTRVVRGGSWVSAASYCRSAYRNYNTPTGRHYNIGFRAVRTLD
jgi:formylglycine-generating enzyme required for sulfatase activity